MAKELTTEHLASIINKAKSIAESKISENEDSKIINTEDELNNIVNEGIYVINNNILTYILGILRISLDTTPTPLSTIMSVNHSNGVIAQNIVLPNGGVATRLKSIDQPNVNWLSWYLIDIFNIKNNTIEAKHVKDSAITTNKILNGAITKNKLHTDLYNELSNESKVFTISIDTKETTELFDYLENGGIANKVIIKVVDEFGAVLAIAGIYSYDNDTVTTNPVIIESRVVMIEFYKTNDYNYVPYNISGIGIDDSTISQSKLSFNPFERSNNVITKLTNLEVIPNKYGTYLYDLQNNLIVTFNESDFNEAHIIIHNTTASAKEIAFPGTDNYILFSGDLLQVPAGAYVELNVIKDPVTEFYYIRFA